MEIVLQDGTKDCGVCSLLSVIRFYGGDVSKEYLREITNTTRNGVSAYNLIMGAKKIGFEAIGVSGDMTKIEYNNLPCLAHVIVSKNLKHFVVIYKIDKEREKVIVMDPAKGKRIMNFSEFKLMSTNNFIFLKPNKKLPFLVNKKVIKKLIKKSIKKNKNIFIILVVLIFSYFILNILVSFHFKYLLNFVVNFGVSNNILIISLIVLVLYLLRSINRFIKNILFIKFSTIIDEVITIKTFKQILFLPYLYYKNRTTGEVITRIKDLNQVKLFLVKLFNVLVTDVVSMIIFFILMFNINKEISIFSFIIILLLGLIIVFRNKFKKKYFDSVCRREEKVNSYLIESLSNVDTIKGGHIEKRLSDKFLYLYRDLLNSSYKYSLFNEVNYFIKDSIKDILLVLIYGIGCFLVVLKKLVISDILIYQSFLIMFINSCMEIINLIDEVDNYKVSLNRVEDLYTISKEKFFGSFYYYNYVLDGDICFNNLTYKYSSKNLFNNLNLVIKQGEKVLLMGNSGSGKSSLVKILMRYLDVPFGMCSISGIDINHYHLENIRSNISYVSSNDYLFTDSLYNNITLEKEVDEDIFNKVCFITRVDKIVKKRDSNYSLLVEENGFNFSNGERQRIILARYLLRNSNIYIFDEAFGQLDINLEKEILSEIFDYLKDKTVIVISHRFYNKNLFDRVIKLSGGNLIEEKV